MVSDANFLLGSAFAKLSALLPRYLKLALHLLTHLWWLPFPIRKSNTDCRENEQLEH